MSDYHDEERSYHIWEERFPNPEQQLNLINEYVLHGHETLDEENEMAEEATSLVQESHDWRPAVSLYWCIWGIVQSVPDLALDEQLRELKIAESTESLGVYKFETVDVINGTPDVEVDEAEELFDYVSYATEKAQLFWTDLVKFGIIEPEEYKGIIKAIQY
jgi:choline kinase